MSFHPSSAAAPAALLLALVPAPAWAGPPFLTDDPVPADYGEWEIFAPTFEIEGRGSDYEGALATEVNYGFAPDFQINIEIPAAFSHDAGGMRWGAGDVELGLKYQFYHNEGAGVSVAFHPSVTLPTGSNGMSADKITALIPIWAQKEFGAWSLFGGGGYAINPGAGNRDYWTGGIAVTRQVSDKFLLGAEVYRDGADTVGGNGTTSLGLGAIYELKAPLTLLVSGGPSFEDHGGGAGFHAYAALGFTL